MFDVISDDQRPGRRLLSITALGAGLSVLLFVIYLLVWDRSETAAAVEYEIGRAWGGSQQVSGPRLFVPYVQTTSETVSTAGQPVERIVRRRGHVLVAPTVLTAQADLDPAVRRRSLFEVVVYRAAIDMRGRFDFDLTELDEVSGRIYRWADARMLFSVSDPGGFVGVPDLSLDGRALSGVEPGVPGYQTLAGTVSAPAGFDGRPARSVDFGAAYALRGSTDFQVEPVAKDADIRIASSWPHPSFRGSLPIAQRIGEDGFRARWSATNLSTGSRLVSTLADQESHRGGPAVALIEPVDLYAQLGRAVKYGVLFIALTFLVYYIFDLSGGHRMPMLAYALVGLGLVQFFLMLLATAEQMHFALAYALSAGGLIVLISLYTRAVLNTRRAVIAGAVISGLYAGLYALLRLEDLALLLGSLTLFAALAILMFATRRVGRA